MTEPTCITEALALLQGERVELRARADAVDLALDNLRRIFPAPAPRRTRRKWKGQSRRTVAAVVKAPAGEGSGAAERRATILALIAKSEVGLTASEIRQATASMKNGDRSNAVHQLKITRQIRRVGNTWVAA